MDAEIKSAAFNVVQQSDLARSIVAVGFASELMDVAGRPLIHLEQLLAAEEQGNKLFPQPSENTSHAEKMAFKERLEILSTLRALVKLHPIIRQALRDEGLSHLVDKME